MRAREGRPQGHQKYTLIIYLFTGAKICQGSEYSERNRLLATICSSHQATQFHLIRVTTGMEVSTSALSSDIFNSWKSAVCPSCVLYTSRKLQGKLLLLAWILGPEGKCIFSLSTTQRENLASKPARTPIWIISLHYSKTLIKQFHFMKETSFLPLLLRSHHTVQFGLIRIMIEGINIY